MDVKGGLVTLVTEGKPFVNKTKHLVYQIVNIQESRASKTNAIPFLYGHQHVITESSTSKCQHIIYQRLLHRQIVNTKPEQECRSWWGSLVSSPCNTQLYQCTMLRCMLCYCLNWWTSLMVDMVACWWPGPSLPHLPAASPALSWCCYGDRARHTVHTPTISLGSYEIVHLNPKPSTLRNTRSLFWVKSCDLDIIHHHLISHYFIIFLLTKKLNYIT